MELHLERQVAEQKPRNLGVLNFKKAAWTTNGTLDFASAENPCNVFSCRREGDRPERPVKSGGRILTNSVRKGPERFALWN